jgi:hypothetical protein
MKLGGIFKPLALAFALAAMAYAACYSYIEHRRVVKGPWQVTFLAEPGSAAMVVDQPALGIRGARVVFPQARTDTNLVVKLEFSQARPVPFNLPFGRCVFLDTLFLPGTVALECFGHEIQLLPRVLTIDGIEHPWRSGEPITVSNPVEKSASRP